MKQWLREYWFVPVATVLAFTILAFKQQWHHPAPPNPAPTWIDPLLPGQKNIAQ